jgi:basic membrane protein A
MVKRYDVAVYDLLAEYAEGALRAGPRHLDLAANGVGITYSGGFLDDVRPQLEALQADIVAGAIEVPCVPADRMDQLEDAGLDPEDPCGPPAG